MYTFSETIKTLKLQERAIDKLIKTFDSKEKEDSSEQKIEKLHSRIRKFERLKDITESQK